MSLLCGGGGGDGEDTSPEEKKADADLAKLQKSEEAKTTKVQPKSQATQR